MALKIGVYPENETLKDKAKALAAKLHLPYVANKEKFEYVIVVSPKYLGIEKQGFKPFYINFLSKRLEHRKKFASMRNESLARALGVKSNEPKPSIVDATAGLGRDGFILASLGFDITLLERSPIVGELLKDGIERASSDETVGPIISRMHLFLTDAKKWLEENKSPDIIYLDPMFPPKQKSALSKKEMQIFQDIIGPDDDSLALFHLAMEKAKLRVIVKRPKAGKPMDFIRPSYIVDGTSSRFDVYLPIGKR